MLDLWTWFWESFFQSSETGSARHKALRAVAWLLLCVALLLLTFAAWKSPRGPWVWAGAGASAVVSLFLFWLSNRPPAEDQG